MSLGSGSAQLHFALKKLRARWQEVTIRWNDRARQEFEENRLAPIEAESTRLLGEINRLDHLLQRARQECADGV